MIHFSAFSLNGCKDRRKRDRKSRNHIKCQNNAFFLQRIFLNTLFMTISCSMISENVTQKNWIGWLNWFPMVTRTLQEDDSFGDDMLAVSIGCRMVRTTAIVHAQMRFATKNRCVSFMRKEVFPKREINEFLVMEMAALPQQKPTGIMWMRTCCCEKKTDSFPNN